MQIQGQYILPAPPDRVWQVLLDPDVLRTCLPGCQELRVVGNDEYAATLSIGMGGIRGTYRGSVVVVDKKQFESYQLEVRGGATSGTIAATGRVELAPSDDRTLVRYTGDYRVAGGIAGIGQRLFQPVAQTIASQFFRCIEQRLSSGDAPDKPG